MSTRQDRLPASQGEGARALLRASGLWYGTPTFLSVYIPRPQCRSLSEWLLLKIYPPPPPPPPPLFLTLIFFPPTTGRFFKRWVPTKIFPPPPYFGTCFIVFRNELHVQPV